MTGSVQAVTTPDGVTRLTLENGARQNAITDTMLLQLLEHLDRLSRDAACRVVVLQGAGEHFCAGRDVGNLEVEAGVDHRAKVALVQKALEALHTFPRPLVAVVKGYCLGLGMGIVAVCDVAMAADNAKFGLPEVKLGIPPALTAVALQRAVGAKWSAYLMLSALFIDGRRAEAIGLVTLSTMPDNLASEADRCIGALANVSPNAVAACKRFTRHDITDLSFHAALEAGVDLTVAAATTADAIEGRRAFREKRPPVWR